MGGIFMGLLMKKEDREKLKELKAEEERLEEEFPEEKIKFVDLLFGEDEEDIALEEALPPNEREELEEIKREEKKLLIRAISIFSGMFIIMIVVLLVFSEATKSDLLKTTLPLFEAYYQEHYQKDLAYESIENLCEKESCSSIAHVTTKNQEHLMSVSNELLGDDISTSKIEENYTKTLEQTLSSVQIVSHYPTLSYQKYFLQYNPHLFYSKVLPYNKAFDDLIREHSLIVHDIVLYQGNLDLANIQSLLSLFHEESTFYFIGQINGIPASLTILSKREQITIPITASIPIDGGTIYELDRTLNAVSSLAVSRVNENDIKTLGDYTITKAYTIKPELRNQDREKTKSSYFFVKLDNTAYTMQSIYEFSLSGYQEYERDDYLKIATYQVGNSTYLIGNQAIGIGSKKEKNGFLCKFGFCK